MSEKNLELLDLYFQEKLNPADRQLLEQRLEADPFFGAEARQHLDFLKLVASAGNRAALKSSLDSFHQSFAADPVDEQPKQRKAVRSLWPMIAVAASVAMISVLTTVFTMKNFSETESKYIDLRRNVEQIEQSQRAQKAILDNIAKNKKSATAPVTYTGSGFMISSSGFVVTSYHVIRDADSVYLQNERFGTLKAKVVRTDQVNDVAVLRIDDNAFSPATSIPFTISDAQAELGEPVYTIGFPRDEVVYGEGTISAATGYKQNITAYQIAVPVNPGNSGGPLMNNRGAVVGMISGIQTETLGAAFAVKSQILMEVIKNIPSDSTGNEIQLPRSNKLRNLDRIQQVKRLRDYVFVVKVYNQK